VYYTGPPAFTHLIIFLVDFPLFVLTVFFYRRAKRGNAGWLAQVSISADHLDISNMPI